MIARRSLAVVAGMLLAAACHRAPADVDPAGDIVADAGGVTIRAEAPQWRYVEIAAATEGEPLRPLPVPAHVEFDPKRTAAVAVPLPGRVETLQVRLGSNVEAGQRLFSVRSGAFAELHRDIEVARTQVAARQRLLTRVRGLFELHAVAEKDVLAAEADLREGELTQQAAEARLTAIAVDADDDSRFWVQASRAGTVVDIDVAPGLEVGPDRDQPLLQLCDLDEVVVVADVPEGDLRDVRVGLAVTIRPSFGADTRDGVVEHVSELLDPRRRTVEVWVRAANHDRQLRPNSFVEVVFAVDASQPLVLVPDGAVVTRGTQSVVFVAAGPDRLEPRRVQLGRRRGGLTEVLDGLQSGERFVARGALLLMNQVDLASDL